MHSFFFRQEIAYLATYLGLAKLARTLLGIEIYVHESLIVVNRVYHMFWMEHFSSREH